MADPKLVMQGTKEYEAAMKRLLELGTPFVTVGVHSKDADRKEGGDVTDAQVAAWNEYGTDSAPARPFLRPTLRENAKQHSEMMGKAVRLHTEGKGLEQELGKVGLLAQSQVRAKITAIKSPPNAQSTIDKKGSSNPLIDTGQMRRAIGFQVHTKGNTPK